MLLNVLFVVATSVHLDGTMPPPGNTIMINQPRPTMEQQGIMMRPGIMPPPGMVSQNVMPMGPQGGPLPPHIQMIGQRTAIPGPAPGGSMGPQPFNVPTSLPGSQTLPHPHQMPNMSVTQTLPGPQSMGGSQTLPRGSIGHVSLGPQGLKGPPSAGATQPAIPGQPTIGGPQPHPPSQPSLNNQPLLQGQPVPLPGVSEAQSMNGPQALQSQGPIGGAQPGMVGPGAGLALGNQTLLSTIPQNALPPHMSAPNLPQMMAPPSGQQVMGQQSFQQPHPPQTQQEDKTAELISFD